MKTPAFWYKKQSKLAYILKPIGKLYAFLTWLRKMNIKTENASIPVICVGNLVLGGSGKTPTVIALVSILKELGYTPHIITRGYKGKTRSTHRVTAEDAPYKVGDEPVLLARHAPTWVGKNRIRSCKKAIRSGADILVFDDGLQNKAVFKDISFMVVDGQQGFGNGGLFPAGPLRTSLDEGKTIVDAIIHINPSAEVSSQLKEFNKPIFEAKFEALTELSPQKVIAFAGLGYPEKFRTFLTSLGFEVVQFLPFPDHHGYTNQDIQKLMNLEKAMNLPLVTTEKDFVKLSHLQFKNLQAIPIKLEFEDIEGVRSFLEDRLKTATVK